jgi:hypothetical protein
MPLPHAMYGCPSAKWIPLKGVCIDDSITPKYSKNWLGSFEVNLTYGKVYELLDDDPDGYCIYDDKGEVKTYKKNRFITITEYKLRLRKKKIERILC